MPENTLDEQVDRPLVRVSVFFDYICPFCYIGSVRLLRLNERFDLRVNWMPIEIHPDTPVEGQSLDALPYDTAQRQAMNHALAALAAEEGLTLPAQRRMANSHDALRLVEAAKRFGREAFYRLHHALFQAYFTEGRNLGDLETLRTVASTSGLPQSLPDEARNDPEITRHLAHYKALASQYAVSGVPTYAFGDQQLNGVQPLATLIAAADRMAKSEG